MQADQMQTLADSLFSAFIAHDYDAIRSLCHADACTWSNASGIEQTVEDLLAFLPRFREISDGHRYDHVRRVYFDDGFFQQHRVVLRALDGSDRDLGEACMIVRVDDEGLIVRFDEYLDTLHAATVLAPTTKDVARLRRITPRR